MPLPRQCLPVFLLAIMVQARAHETAAQLDPVIVYGRTVDLLGTAHAASDGQVGAAELAARPFLRRGELLEVVPGVVVTQHSGAGKANQYFLRGFNLDHGTDFAVSVDGLPVNLRTHAHGQGYADINFLIPELVSGVTYQKGQFTAANGDFSAAGAAQFHLVDELPQALARVEAGENDYYRLVLAGTTRQSGGGATTLGFEAGYNNGPWVLPEHNRRFNLFARYTWNHAPDNFALTLMGYRGEWTSTDQIPARAVEAGTLDRFGFIDASDGGESDRVSLAFDWDRHDSTAETRLNLHAIRYRLDLYSNFTYLLDDPADGDQFNQRDARTLLGGSLTHTRTTELAGRKFDLEIGAQTRTDLIAVGLHRSTQRARLATVRDDDVTEMSGAVYAQGTWHASDSFRATAGLRADGYRFDVDSDNPLNSGKTSDAIFSPKLALVFKPAAKTELYAAAGMGFHSNDARGTVIRVDPADGVTPADRVDPLVRAKSAEVGLRTAFAPGLVSTVSVWALDLASELVFVGDAGGTEASGATRRYGVEFANFYRPVSWLSLDADLAFTHGRYRDEPADANLIANSVDTVVSAGVSVDLPEGAFGSLRARYFGPQPLIEDDSVRAPSSLTYNLRAGWRNREWELAVDVLNLFDRENNDIAYFYTSRLPGEPTAGTDDIHFHPAEPRTIRVSVSRRF
ncbi:MAG TPA: TonB-dependent receptor [Lacunisphaera sp.]|nr:TonB-dependent receptor [Lacunisphaera sp.]